MANFVSPGVFTRENDMSYLQQGVSDIGAAIIGPTIKGPAMVPITVNTYSEFQQAFGGLWNKSYVPYAAKEYLAQGSALTVIRTLHDDGYSANVVNLYATASMSTYKTASYNIAIYQSMFKYEAVDEASSSYTRTEVAGTARKYYIDNNTIMHNGMNVLNENAFTGNEETNHAIGISQKATTSDIVINFATLHPSQIVSQTTFDNGSTTGFNNAKVENFNDKSNTFELTVAGTYKHDDSLFGNGTDSINITASLNPQDVNYIGNLLAKSPETTTDIAYTSQLFNIYDCITDTTPADESLDITFKIGNYNINNITGAGTYYLSNMPETTTNIQQVGGTGDIIGYVAVVTNAAPIEDDTLYITKFTNISAENAEYKSESTYSEAITPWIISQTISGKNKPLFRFHTFSAGNDTNHEIKVMISNIKPAGTVAGSDYGSFTVTIRAVDQQYFTNSVYDYTDTDFKQNILETFTNVNLDPASPNYIGQLIGTQHKSYENQHVSVNGDYSNRSNYVWVELDEDMDRGAYSPTLVPFGFEPLKPISDNAVAATFVTNQYKGIGSSSVFNKRICLGFDFTDKNNMNYLSPIPNTPITNDNNTAFILSMCTDENGNQINLETDGTATDINSRKFIVPFQGGFDGCAPNRVVCMGDKITSENTMGYDLSSTRGKDYSVYKNALDMLSNTDEFDINMLLMPGVNQNDHPSIIEYAANMCSDRADTFFVVDCVGSNSSVVDAISAFQSTDNNYMATYYPWVKVMDTQTNKPMLIPPSAVLGGVIAFSDRVAAPWFAPAGLNRGAITSAIDAKIRLNASDRDTLYENRVNPIAYLNGHGIVVWGQKTLQARASALDRVNVRRLLIYAKKLIASSVRYLVFEQNTEATRTQFVNMVNPILDTIKQRQGLYDFRVVCDESINTADVIDRNVLKAQLWLKPTRTIEFISIDFNITSSGATFEDETE